MNGTSDKYPGPIAARREGHAGPMSLFDNLKRGLQVEVVCFDQYVVQYEFRCSNGRFSGHANIYLGRLASIGF